ncbi:hypothetical protein [Janthinobacterium sp. 64]|nr:hypothetical protein [Janthinobacterium sp. 64]PKB21396.1 hypothetical protein CLU91_1774 [Janthinobacterium sp. 64]
MTAMHKPLKLGCSCGVRFSGQLAAIGLREAGMLMELNVYKETA